MAAQKIDAKAYLKPRDVETIPQSRGREPSILYPTLVEAFVAANERAMDVDVEKIGRKPETVRSGLVKATKALGLQDKVRVSLVGGEVILRLR